MPGVVMIMCIDVSAAHAWQWITVRLSCLSGRNQACRDFPTVSRQARQAESDTSGLAHVAHAGNARYNGGMHSLDWLSSPAPRWIRLQDAVRAGTHRRTIQRWVVAGHLQARRDDESNSRSCLYVDALRLAELQSMSGRELPPAVAGGTRRG